MVGELIDQIDVYHAEKRDGVTNQRVVIHYNCIGAFDVPDRRKIPEAAIIMETRKGVALSYAPAQIAVWSFPQKEMRSIIKRLSDPLMILRMVRVTRFERAISWSQTKRDTKLRYTRIFYKIL